MEFLNYIDKVEVEIIRIIEEAGYFVEENTNLCQIGNEYVGFLRKKKKKIVICTNNAKRRENYKNNIPNRNAIFDRSSMHIKKALRHEAVHVAQECNNGNLLNLRTRLKLNPAKLNALKGSTKISGEVDKEIQAYILEDRPKQVISELKKYCL